MYKLSYGLSRCRIDLVYVSYWFRCEFFAVSGLSTTVNRLDRLKRVVAERHRLLLFLLRTVKLEYLRPKLG